MCLAFYDAELNQIGGFAWLYKKELQNSKKMYNYFIPVI